MHTSPPSSTQTLPSESAPQQVGELAGSDAPVDRVHLHRPCPPHPIRLPLPPTNPPCPLSQRSAYPTALPKEQRAGSTGHTPRLPAQTLPSAVAPPTRAHSHEPSPRGGRSLPPPRAHATYLACVVRHTSTSSVGWIAAHVVHVAAAEIGRAEVNIRLCPVCVVCAAVGCGLEVGVCSGTSFLRAAGCSIRRQCSHRFTVRGGRTDAGGGRLSSERQPPSLIAYPLLVTR